MSTKYSNLPDIDTSQPDVYETPDLPVSQEDLTEPEVPYYSQDIHTGNLPIQQAAARFRHTTGDDLNETTALARYQRSLFRSLQLESLTNGNTDLEVVNGGGLKETPEQKLRRLCYETQELREQLSQNKHQGQGGGGGVALMQLAGELNNELEQLSLKSDHAKQSVVSRDVWQKLDGQQPEQPKRSVVSRASESEMEQRVARLEKLLGNSTTGGGNLLDRVGRLRHHMDVLADPQRVDGIQRRIKQTLVDMDRLEMMMQKSNHQMDSNTVKRVNELYEKFRDIDSLVELAPATAERLRSLSTLHMEASDVVARVGKMEREQGNMDEELQTIRDIALSLENTVGGNSKTLKENMRGLDRRIVELNERLEKINKY